MQATACLAYLQFTIIRTINKSKRPQDVKNGRFGLVLLEEKEVTIILQASTQSPMVCFEFLLLQC
jgi:hypothetical protein